MNYKARRSKIMEQMGPNSVGIWFSAPPRTRSHDTEYPYRQHSDFSYLTGCEEPGAALLLIPSENAKTSIFFVRSKEREKEIWEGRRIGPKNAKEHFGVDAAYSISELEKIVLEKIIGCEKIFLPFGIDAHEEERVRSWIEKAKRQRRTGNQTPSQVHDASQIVHEHRLFKDANEMKCIRKATRLSAEAHKIAMKKARPGCYEYELEAHMRHHMQLQGASGFSYPPIVGRGDNATILHYTENQDKLRDGDLVLIDAGAEVKNYAGDITRTFPVNGRFSEKQRHVYEIVLQALEAGLACCKPGNRFNDIHEAAVAELTKGLVKIEVLEGKIDELLETEAYKPFYMHKTGHWMGLDVHDVGRYFEKDGTSRILQPGMVFTIEPGLYFNPDYYQEIPSATPFADIGIRIEDNVLITQDGYENLTKDAPRTIHDIESWMQETLSNGEEV